MKIAILTSGILPVPAVQGGAVETLIDYYLEYNDKHHLHDITIFSVYNPKVTEHKALKSTVNHYQFIDTTSSVAKLRKKLHSLIHRHTYYHYSMDYYLKRVLSKICSDNYDCIILENRPGYALQLRQKSSARIVYHLHNDFLNSDSPHAHELYDAAWRIITVSDYIRRRVQTCDASDTKTIVVHNGIDTQSFKKQQSVTRNMLGFQTEDYVLAFSGRLVREKGIAELIDAVNLLSDYPHIKLMVMGSSFFGNATGSDPFIDMLKSKELGKRIVFTGFISHDMIPNYLRLSDVAVIPSIWEDPFPTTVLEGMAAGLPLITTDCGGIPEMVTEQNAVVLSATDNLTEQLANAILSLYNDEARCKTMGEASLKLSERYQKETYSQAFFNAIALEK